MKKLVSLVLAIALCAVCTGCTKQDSVKISRGTVENGIYRNESMGITVEAGDGWEFFSDEEMAQIYGASGDEFLTDDAADALQNASIIHDMYCVRDGASINVNFENAGVLAIAVADEKAYLELSAENLKTQLDESSGMSISKSELGEIETKSGTAPCLFVTLSLAGQGTDIYEVMVAKKQGSFFGVVAISALAESDLADIAKTVSLK